MKYHLLPEGMKTTRGASHRNAGDPRIGKKKNLRGFPRRFTVSAFKAGQQKLPGPAGKTLIR